MIHATIDQSQFPIVYIKFSTREATRAEADAYLNELTELNERNEPFSVVFDSSESSYLTSELCVRQGDLIKHQYSLIKKNCIGSAYVIPSFMIRFMLSAIFSIQNHPSNYTVVSSLNEAYKWAEEQTFERVYA
jgi:hypothetical protein